MLIILLPLHRQLRLWRRCGLQGCFKWKFLLQTYTVQSSRRAIYATISQRPFGHIKRFCYFPLKKYIWYCAFGWFNKRIHQLQHYIHKYVTLIYMRCVYFFIRGSFNDAVGKSGIVTQHGMVGYELGRAQGTAILFKLRTHAEIWDWDNYVGTKPA